MPKTVIDELVEAAEEAVGGAERIIAVCEADLAAGRDPSPTVKSCPSSALAECYASTCFIDRLRKAIAAVKTPEGS